MQVVTGIFRCLCNFNRNFTQNKDLQTAYLAGITYFVFQDADIWVSYVSIVLVILFVVMFAIGPGSIPWFLVAELFNQSARGKATSLAVTINWAANFLVGIGFLPLQVSLVAPSQ
jgi:hypothetical protein